MLGGIFVKPCFADRPRDPRVDALAGAAPAPWLTAIRVATLGAAHPKTTRLQRRLASTCRAAGEDARADAIERDLEPPAASDDAAPTDPPPAA